MPDLNVSLILRMVDRLSGPLGEAVNGVSEAGKVTAATGAKLAKLGETEKAVAGFVRLKAETGTTATALSAAQAKVAGIAREMRGVETPTKAMTAAFTAAKREAAALKTAHGELLVKTEGARRGLAAMGVSTRNLGSEQRRLKTEIEAATRAADREAKSADRMARIRGMVGGTGGLGAQVAGVAGGVGMAAGVKASLGAAGDFEFQLAQMAVTADASMDVLGDWRIKLLGVARDTVQTREKVAEGAAALIAAGLAPEKAFGALQGIGRTATAETADFLDLSKTAVTLMQTMGFSAEKVGRGLEIMAVGGKAGNFEIKAMARYFPVLTSAARQLGMEGEEGVASIAAALQVARMGAGDEAEAANNMANFLKAATTQEAEKNFEKHGINLKKRLAEGVKKGGNPIEVMMGLIGKAAGVNLEAEMAKEVASGKKSDEAAAAVAQKFKLGELFNDAQVLNFIAPMMAHFKEYKQIKADALSGKGVVDTDFDKMMASWEKETQRATIAVSGLSEGIGHALIPVLLPLVKGFADAAVALSDLVNAYPRATAGVVGLVGGFMAIRGALGVFRLVSGVAGVLGSLAGPIGAAGRLLPILGGGLRVAGSALPLVAGGVRAIGAALFANPIGLVIGAIAAAAYLIYDNWETIGPWFQALWARITGVAEQAWGVVKTLFDWSPLGLVVNNWDAIVGWFSGLWSRITGPSDQAWSGLKTLFDWSPLAALGGAWDGVKGYFKGLFDDVSGTVGRALDWIDAKIKSAIGWITGIRDKIGATVDWVAGSLGLSGSSDKPTVAGVAPPQPANLNTPPPANDSRPARLPAVAGGGSGPTTYTLNLTLNLNGVVTEEAIKQAKEDMRREFASMVRDIAARRASLYDHG